MLVAKSGEDADRRRRTELKQAAQALKALGVREAEVQQDTVHAFDRTLRLGNAGRDGQLKLRAGVSSSDSRTRKASAWSSSTSSTRSTAGVVEPPESAIRLKSAEVVDV